MMRIITGSARGTKLLTLEGENTRPTAERVKEAVFSMIQFDIEERSVLDLFAGSGQLALEALSRGAARAVITDSSRDAVEIIIQNAKKTHLFDKCRISCVEYTSFIRSAAGRESFDLVFLDPPYSAGLIPDVLKKLTDGGLLAPEAYVICETDAGTGARPSRRLSREEREAVEAAAVQKDIFGDCSDLSARFTMAKTIVYGRSRITVLHPVERED